MRVIVDPERCMGNALCEAVSPALFSVDDDGTSQVLQDPVDERLRAEAERAEANCPTQAISIVDD